MGPRPFSWDPSRLPTPVIGMRSFRILVELGKRVGTRILLLEEGGCGGGKERPRWGGCPLAALAKGDPSSLLWAAVSVPLARALGPRRVLLQMSWSLFRTLSSLSWAIMGVSWGSPTMGQAGRVRDGPVPLNSHLSLPRTAVPAGLCPQFQPLAVCPPRTVPPACDTELSGACGPWGPHRQGLPGECGVCLGKGHRVGAGP